MPSIADLRQPIPVQLFKAYGGQMQAGDVSKHLRAFSTSAKYKEPTPEISSSAARQGYTLTIQGNNADAHARFNKENQRSGQKIDSMHPFLREANPNDASSISALVQAGFMEHVAPDWELSAQQEFLKDTTAETLASRISEATFVAVYEDAGRILGVIAMPRPTLVQLFFVAPTHLRRGIGKCLWEAARADVEERYPEVKTVELNSTPYAVSAYRSLGFYPISEPFRRKGAVATRMACWLPGRALAQAQNAA